MDSLNSFYYKISNINKSNNIEIIEQVIEVIKLFMQENDIDSLRMCKVFSNLIYNELTSRNVACKIINTKELFGCYEHEFVIAHFYKDDKINYVLIDLTYSQFVTKGITNELLYSLLNNGYCLVDDSVLDNYLFSIHQDKNIDKYSLQELIMEVKKR